MAKRTRRGTNSTNQSIILRWIIFILLCLVIVLLGYSLYLKKTPASVLKSLMPTSSEQSTTKALSKKELIRLTAQQDSTIRSLQQDLAAYNYQYVLEQGFIDVDASTLNLRREPTIDSEVKLKIPDSSRVIILYYNNAIDTVDGVPGQWCKIKYQSEDGWVWGKYVVRE